MPDNPESENVTLAVLRNDLIHLSAAVTASIANWSSWRLEQERENKIAAAERAHLHAEVTVIKWAFGLITVVVLGLVVASLKEMLGF